MRAFLIFGFLAVFVCLAQGSVLPAKVTADENANAEALLEVDAGVENNNEDKSREARQFGFGYPGFGGGFYRRPYFGGGGFGYPGFGGGYYGRPYYGGGFGYPGYGFYG
ncbi:glycine-rich cell wall structural protein-like [Teleopsis dalmanni]|uniref:glycine-rich cell wall structural protein-like n=1 Tax=Teleopsis dalmanni TaxID=139649 RepID=UPI0018CEA0AF|nr:glycine-rich cell wall structural protein-like [Teleopsis dalmanni]XP_037943801.1 glycine-rich cell wall structural protein-like [Teleopsis dalmanni]